MITKDVRFYFMVVLLASISLSEAGSRFLRMRNKLEEWRRERIQKQYIQWILQTQGPDTLPSKRYPTQYQTQPLDHFNPEIQRTFEQRFWVSHDFWNAPDGPVFLLIGGEGGTDHGALLGGEAVHLAYEYGALLVAAEHRFYGGSINKDGLELGQLQYLSSQQALADLASLHSNISSTFGLTEKNTWMCFGGSYAGSLSAWFRIKYPHLVYAAVASSAPVQAKVNFQGYNNVVAKSLSDPIVNGSTECVSVVRDAFQTVDSMIANGQLEDLATDFNACTNLTSKSDLFQFVSSLSDLFEFVVQYNDEIGGNSIYALCGHMLHDSGSPYQRLVKNVRKADCTESSWSKMISELKNTTVTGSLGVGIRQWLYQSCTQFGYFQTCDEGSECLFSQYQDLEHNLKICSEVYGLKPDTVMRAANFTNEYYGSNYPKGTRIVFVNGSIDPWHWLSVLTDLSSSEIAVYINGTAHCANMHSSESSDRPQLTEARKEISKQVGLWLEAAKST